MSERMNSLGAGSVAGAATLRRPWQSVTVSAVGGPPPAFPVDFCGSNAELAELMAEHWRQRIAIVLPDRPDMIVLPEMCDRFLGTPAKVLHEVRPVMFAKMSAMLAATAKENHCYIVHSTAAQSVGAGSVAPVDAPWQNVAILIDRSGRETARYSKNWLVPTEAEKGICKGSAACVAQCDFGTVGFAICFDLNFSELLDAYRQLRPDLLVFPSNFHGGFLQQHWAYEARAHFIGCMGMAGIESRVLSPLGTCLASSSNYYPHLTTSINLDCVVAHLDGNWEKLRALKEHYGREVSIDDPGRIGSVLISSRSPQRSAAQMAEDFSIELLDGYLARSRALARHLHERGGCQN